MKIPDTNAMRIWIWDEAIGSTRSELFTNGIGAHLTLLNADVLNTRCTLSRRWSTAARPRHHRLCGWCILDSLLCTPSPHPLVRHPGVAVTVPAQRRHFPFPLAVLMFFWTDPAVRLSPVYWSGEEVSDGGKWSRILFYYNFSNVICKWSNLPFFYK